MQNLSIGKLRGLQRCASPRGTFTALALDHRQNLRRALNPQNPSAVTDEQLAGFKLEVAAALAGEATAVLFDPEYSAAQAVAAGIIPNNAGLVVALEATGYSGDPTARQSQILPGWSVEKAKRMGVDMVKLLVYYHPDSPTAAEIEAFVEQVAGDCLAHDLGLMLEPLSYSLDPGVARLPSAERRYVVTETARRLTIPGVDLLKAEFPLDSAAESDESAWQQACAEVSAACAAPWILLSAAADYETYLSQVTAACRAGASGVAVGRAVWKETVDMDAHARAGFLQAVARLRLARLNALCVALARPWTDFYTAGAIDSQWYPAY
ncbi:MAG: tagatose 1,6-diphosphate aldolase [Anaerolineales bacterium]|nr:tagatose 1,6-diphosphate aldolase [Anaerolineales bacterium]